MPTQPQPPSVLLCRIQSLSAQYSSSQTARVAQYCEFADTALRNRMYDVSRTWYPRPREKSECLVVTLASLRVSSTHAEMRSSTARLAAA